MKLTSFCTKLHYEGNLHAGRLNARRKEYILSVINCLVSVRRRRSYFFSSFNPGGWRITYIRKGHPALWSHPALVPDERPFSGEKFIYTFVLLQFEFIRLYRGRLSMQKGDPLSCVRPTL